MSVAETLLNATLVLIPLWLGLVRYLTTEAEFESETIANLIGIGIVIVLMGILYSMSTSIETLALEQPELRNGLYVLFITLTLTGLGGVFFIIREIPEIHSEVIVGVPLITIIAASIVLILIQLLTGNIPYSLSRIVSQIFTIAITIWALIRNRHLLIPSKTPEQKG